MCRCLVRAKSIWCQKISTWSVSYLCQSCLEIYCPSFVFQCFSVFPFVLNIINWIVILCFATLSSSVSLNCIFYNFVKSFSLFHFLTRSWCFWLLTNEALHLFRRKTKITEMPHGYVTITLFQKQRNWNNASFQLFRTNRWQI